MKKITGEEFIIFLTSNENHDIENFEIIFEEKESFHPNNKTSYYSKNISNCIFKGQLNINQSAKEIFLNLNFTNCTFDSINIHNCKFHELKFQDITVNDSILIGLCEINEFEIENSFLNGKITLHRNKFAIDFILTSTEITKMLYLRNNIFPHIELKNNSSTTIKNCSISYLKSYNNDFGTDFSFTNNTLSPNHDLKENSFQRCDFRQASFNNNSFVNITLFDECTFNSTIHFEQINNSSYLKITNSNFQESVSFNYSDIHTLLLDSCIFQNLTFFQDTKFENISIDRTIFEKPALFDDIKIKANHCTRRTLRNIKLQLQRSENKIDYNRFRSYELEAYYLELNWKWNEGFKDKVILGATKLSTGFEHSWRRALAFTLLSAVLSYSLFFISENYRLVLELSNWKIFASGYFRFLLVTDFYNPLSDGRHYIDSTNTIGWFIFILGKIFIAFGIYEMIQAFRKFKA